MAFRLYIVPIIGIGTEFDPRRPKYFENAEIVGTQSWTCMDYGPEPWMVVGANLDTATDNLIVGEDDCFALPFDLAGFLSPAQVTAVQTKLEAANIPANWVTTAQRWIEVVRTVLGMFSFMQRLAVYYGGPVFVGSVRLSRTFGTLPAALQAALVQTAESFGIPTTGLTASTTLRAILRAMADYFSQQRYSFNGVWI